MGIDLPELREHAPEFVQLNERVAVLRAEQKALSEKTPDLMKRAREKGVFSSGEIFSGEPKPAPVPSKREQVARALLGSFSPAAVPAPAPVRDPIGDDLARHSERLAEIQCAIDLMMSPPPGGGLSVWDRERIKASRAYCEAVRPAYQKIAARYVAALLEIGEAIKDHAEFAYGMKRRGVAWASLRPLTMIAPPPQMRSAALHSALAWAIESGWAPPEAMPPHWLKPDAEAKAAAEHQLTEGPSAR